MKFKFSLEPVLKVRKHREKIQKQKLAEELSNKKQINSRRARMKKMLEDYLQGVQNEEFGNIHNIKRHSRHMQQVHQKMEQLTVQLKEAENAVNNERIKLADVHKQRNVMEKAKEMERKKFVERMAKHEQRIMDEIATQTYSQ